MSYDCHITRRKHWADDEAPGALGDLRREDWLRVVETEPDLTGQPGNPDEFFWLGHPRAEDPPLWWEGDTAAIRIQSPDLETLQRAVQLARQLDAHVQGDDGEVYGDDGLPLPPERRSSSRRSFWRRSPG
jgi:hypothetical protein